MLHKIFQSIKKEGKPSNSFSRASETLIYNSDRGSIKIKLKANTT